MAKAKASISSSSSSKPGALTTTTLGTALAGSGKPKTFPVQHVGSGKYSDVFKVRLGPRSVMMKILFYRHDTMRDFAEKATRGDVAGAMASKRQDAISVGKEFGRFTMSLLDRVSPHFAMVYCTLDVKDFALKFRPMLDERLRELSKVQRRYNNVCFMEAFSSDLTKYLTRGRYTEEELRGIIFQVLYTLAALQKLLPGFRHNDLSTNNILVKRARKRVVNAYTINGNTFTVKGLPVFVALADYDFVHVPNNPLLGNERIINGNYRVDGRPNASYDTHFFLKSVYKCILPRAHKFPATTAFLTGIGLRQEDRQNEQIPHLAPILLLANPYFNALRGGAKNPDSAYVV